MNNEARAQAAVDAIKDRTVYSLAGDADCASPDSETSPGARLLTHVRDAVTDLIEYDPDAWREAVDTDDVQSLDYNGAVSEIADGAPSVYTNTRWTEFADLAAWQEDPTELGFEGSDMTQAAGICLYMIAERLAWALIEEAKDNTPDADEDNDQ